MKRIDQRTASQLPESIATGNVYMSVVIAGEESPGVRVGRMYFAPDSRTAWHSHAGGEYLHVLEGKALVQEHGGDITTLKAGETVFTEPNVEHWHGAPSDGFTVLLAVWGARNKNSDKPETSWGSQVSDEEAARK